MTCLNDPTHVRSNILILASLERLLSVEQIRNTADSALRCWGVGGWVGMLMCAHAPLTPQKIPSSHILNSNPSSDEDQGPIPQITFNSH